MLRGRDDPRARPRGGAGAAPRELVLGGAAATPRVRAAPRARPPLRGSAARPRARPRPAAARAAPRHRRGRQLDGDARRHGHLGGGELDRLALPREGGDPGLAVVGRPRLVLEQREQPAALLAGLDDQRRAHEAVPAQAEPPPGDLEPVGRRPGESLHLERDRGRHGTTRCVDARHRTPAATHSDRVRHPMGATRPPTAAGYGAGATYHRRVESIGEASSAPRAIGSRQALAELQRVTDAALSHLDLDDLLQELLVRATEILRTDTAAILLLNEDTGMLHARAAKGIEEEVEQGVRIPVGRGFAGRIAAERRPVYIPDVD